MKTCTKIKLDKNVIRQLKLIAEINRIDLNCPKNFQICCNIYKTKLN